MEALPWLPEMQKEVDVYLLRQITKYYSRENPYTLVIPILSTMKITLSTESSARNFPKTWGQSDSFIQHQQTLKIRLFLKNISYGTFQYAIFLLYLFTTAFKKISLQSKDKIFANIYLCAFRDGGAHLFSVQNHQFWDTKSTLGCHGTTEEPPGMGGEKSNKLHCIWRTSLVFPHFATPISQSFKFKIIHS